MEKGRNIVNIKKSEQMLVTKRKKEILKRCKEFKNFRDRNV